MPQIINNASFTAVSDIFINEYLPDANAEFVRVYLYALSHSGEELTNADIAEKLKILESDVIKAWKYWEKCGIVEVGDGIKLNEVRHKPEEKKVSGSKHPSRAEVAELLSGNKELRAVNDHVQSLLGRTLTPGELASICWLYAELGLPADVIMMLSQYCRNDGKTSVKYIEKVGISWKEKGIDTPEAVEEFCKRNELQKRTEGKIKAVLGIPIDRNFTDSERKYVERWTKEFGFSPEAVAIAYDQTMINTGKLSWAYLNTILTNWHKKGLISEEKIKEAMNGRTARKPNKFSNFSQKGVDGAAVEKAAMRKLMNEEES